MNEIIKRTMIFYIFMIMLISVNMRYIDELWLKLLNLITFIVLANIYLKLYTWVKTLKYDNNNTDY